ncbi:MAG TPA: ABC transporter ATP-binding protein [Terriglobia bacterium]|nr:ABC transporter ATP-binding protein [Terriglobia bacterium]
MIQVVLDSVGLRFGGYSALQDLSFEVPQGQFVAIVGPTGCGKSSVLNLIGGLLKPSAGRVLSGGREIATINRDAVYMFQQDALLPWKTALENVVLGPLLRGVPKQQAVKEARVWLERVGLRDLGARFPSQLSGGQRKRVAMAQALINRLPILLMDESFSALDAQTRALMENELLELWQEIGATVLFVTHDLEEAIAMADRVLLFTAGPNARLKGDYPVRLPRPRNVAEARFIPGFAQIYETVWRNLKEEVMAGYAG